MEPLAIFVKVCFHLFIQTRAAFIRTFELHDNQQELADISPRKYIGFVQTNLKVIHSNRNTYKKLVNTIEIGLSATRYEY